MPLRTDKHQINYVQNSNMAWNKSKYNIKSRFFNIFSKKFSLMKASWAPPVASAAVKPFPQSARKYPRQRIVSPAPLDMTDFPDYS